MRKGSFSERYVSQSAIVTSSWQQVAKRLRSCRGTGGTEGITANGGAKYLCTTATLGSLILNDTVQCSINANYVGMTEA